MANQSMNEAAKRFRAAARKRGNTPLDTTTAVRRKKDPSAKRARGGRK